MAIRAPMGKRMPDKIVGVENNSDDLYNPKLLRLRRAYYRNRRHTYATIGKKDPYAVESKRVPRWDGGLDTKNNRKYKSSVWKPIWDFMQENSCSNIEGYITAQFNRCGTSKQHWTVPEPNHMRNSTALASYSEYTQEVARSFPKSLVTQCNIFDGELILKQERMPGYPIREYWRLVLEDTHNDLTPLFRLCILVAEGIDSVMRFRYAALDQLLLDPNSYQLYWTNILPHFCFKPVVDLLSLEDEFKTDPH